MSLKAITYPSSRTIKSDRTCSFFLSIVHIPYSDSGERCADGRTAEATSSGAAAERPEQPGPLVQLVPPVPPVPGPPAPPEATAAAVSRSEVAGWPSCCPEGVTARLDLVLGPMLN